VSQFHAVSFDLDGTLWKHAACNSHGLRIVLPRLMSHLPEDDPERVVNLFNAVFLELVKKYGLSDRRAFSRKKRFGKLLDLYGVHDPEVVQQLSSTYHSARRLSMRSFLRHGAVRTIERLREAGIGVGIISDGSPAVQRQTVRALGLEPFMDFIVTSGTEGYNKPHERLFRRAIELAGVTPEKMLHVGKSPVTDVLGARRAGVSSAWLQTGDRQMPRNFPEADHTITNLTEIAGLVEDGSPGENAIPEGE